MRRIFLCLLRSGNKRIAARCNYCHNEEDGRKDKQDWIIISFQLPYLTILNKALMGRKNHFRFYLLPRLRDREYQ